MGLSDFFGQQHEEVTNASHEHKGSLTHEAIAGAAAYEALKAYNEHLEREGKPVSHAKAKEILAGFAGAALDKLVETKGLDFIDKQKAKRHAEEQLELHYDQEYQ
ncbi:hypothetical protein BC940DRAFT_311921 [Gongronella butleri]|nr:hypothetical protein BC940DRAFT_311921 [Gongronella butleri]